MHNTLKEDLTEFNRIYT